MQPEPRRWPGFDKCVETQLRLDVYIRPWPPGWSFLRRIYTSRGSERVDPIGLGGGGGGWGHILPTSFCGGVPKRLRICGKGFLFFFHLNCNRKTLLQPGGGMLHCHSNAEKSFF